MRIGIIGAGKLTQGIIGGLLEAKIIERKDIWATTKSSKSSAKVRRRFRISCDSKIDSVKLKKSDVVILGAKPHHLEEMCQSLLEAGLKESTLILSVLAGVSTQKISKALGQKNPVLLSMTNTPALVGEAMTTLFKGRHAKMLHISKAKKIFTAVGRVMVLPEKYFSEVTALSASSPAFVFYFIQEMAAAGAKLGIPKKKAVELCAQAFRGAATLLLESEESTETLINNVTTPGGCTAEGMKTLKSSNYSKIASNAILRTRDKSKKLS